MYLLFLLGFETSGGEAGSDLAADLESGHKGTNHHHAHLVILHI